MTTRLVLHFTGDDHPAVEIEITDDQTAALEAHAAVAQMPIAEFLTRLFEVQLQKLYAETRPEED